ncbi:MAG: alpha/beta hydrolase [Anaerolineae bacterium]|nr:alpha/beta hydrolase [Anaerolineae bacterium]
MQPYDHLYIQTNGIQLHVVQSGPEDGKPVILLHGFPEFWYGWRHQIDALAAAGYRVWAPDQRGYNLSDKPEGIAAYNLDKLAADVIGLIDAMGHERVRLIGHDWGAAVAWWTANKFPERLEKLVILNVPHHAVFQNYLRTHASQLRKSWYVFAMQIPWLPEQMMQTNNFQAMSSAIRSSARPGTFSDEDMIEYRQAWAQPHALTSMMNWYRAVIQQPPASLPSPRITVPTLIIWGKHDAFLEAAMAEESVRLCEDGKLVFLDTTHWVQHETPEQVNQLILDFFQS